jgi:hypothetical protein
MIPLFRKLFPSHKADLIEALDEALHRFFEKPGTIVDLRSRVFPYVDLIAINLDGGIVDSAFPSISVWRCATRFAIGAMTLTLKPF